MTTHTLTYPAGTDPQPGSLVGPGLDGRWWFVLGTTVADDGRSQVIFDELDMDDVASKFGELQAATS